MYYDIWSDTEYNDGYLAERLVSDTVATEANSSLAPVFPLFLWTMSKDRHPFSSVNISLMSGLSTEFGEVHDMAISTAFQAELMLNSPCNLGSTTFWISPPSTMGITHWSMRMISSDALTIAFLAGDQLK